MASNIPQYQIRAVDPFSSYNSDTVNKLTRAVTHGEDGISITRDCDVILHPTINTQVILTPGVVFKDDVWINITSPHTVDFTDPEHYHDFSSGFDEPGWYYVVLQYKYLKQQPAPQASVLILKPSQRSVYSTSSDLLFLKAVHASGSGPFYVDDVSDYDPENPENKRKYIRRYSGTEIILPTFNPTTDVSRIVFVPEQDKFYFGHNDEWKELGIDTGSGDVGTTIQIDTIGFNVGDLVYVTPSGSLALAKANLPKKTADGVVTLVSTEGLVQVTGKVSDVKVESGVSINVGDLLYLSNTEEGKITNIKTSPVHQFVGRCSNVIDSTSIEMYFVRGEPGGQNIEFYEDTTYLEDSIGSSAWTSSGLLYYYDLDISNFVGKNVRITIWETASGYKIVPTEIEFLSNNVARIWVSSPLDVEVFATGPAETTPLTNFVKRITFNLPSSAWNGSGPYYQDVDLSSFLSAKGNLLIYDSATDEVIAPEDIQFHSSFVRIWMSDNTKTLRGSIVGPTNAYDSIVSIVLTLESGNWVLMGNYYSQEIDLSAFDSDNIVLSIFDKALGKAIEPFSVQSLAGNRLRVLMPIANMSLNVTILGLEG